MENQVKPYEMHPTECKCGETLDHASDVTNTVIKPPRTGDVTVCVKCAQIFIFNEELVPEPVPVSVARKVLAGDVMEALDRIRQLILTR